MSVQVASSFVSCILASFETEMCGEICTAGNREKAKRFNRATIYIVFNVLHIKEIQMINNLCLCINGT